MIKRVDDARDIFRLDGYRPPKEVTNLLDTYDELHTAAYQTPTIDYAELAKTPKAAPGKFRDQVQQFMVNQQIRVELETSLDVHMRTELTRLVRREANAIIAALRPRFDAGREIVGRARALGITASTSAERILELGDDAIASWRKLPNARMQLDSVAGHVARLANAGVYGDHYRASHDLRQIKAARVLHTINHPAIAVFGGLPPQTPAGMWLTLCEAGLRLNTVEQARALLDGVDGYFAAELNDAMPDLSTPPQLPIPTAPHQVHAQQYEQYDNPRMPEAPAPGDPRVAMTQWH